MHINSGEGKKTKQMTHWKPTGTHSVTSWEREWEMPSSYRRTDGSPNLLCASLPKDNWSPNILHLRVETFWLSVKTKPYFTDISAQEGKLCGTNTNVTMLNTIEVLERPLATLPRNCMRLRLQGNPWFAKRSRDLYALPLHCMCCVA